MDLHREAINEKIILEAKVLTGGFVHQVGKTPEYLAPALQAKYFDDQSRLTEHVYVEFRPEVDLEKIEHFLKEGFDQSFDFQMISTIYLPDNYSYDQVRQWYFDFFGVQSLYKWSQKLDFVANLESNSLKDWEAFVQATGNSRGSLNLDHFRDLPIDFSSLKNSLHLYRLDDYQKVLQFLKSSQNFGVAPYVDLRKIMSENEFQIWNQLQELVVARAKQRSPLTKEIVDEFLKLAAASTNNHPPVGYRHLEATHEIWPGGKRMGDFWIFSLQEAQHFFREPYFELPTNIIRLSATQIAVPRLSYRSPGDIKKQVEILIEKYHEVSATRSPELAAILFYRDLIALHPLTDGNGRGCRALLSFLFLSSGLPPPSFERISIADLYVESSEMIRFFEMGVWRGRQSILFGGPPH